MAGGMGKRLGKAEKPLTDLAGKPMIEYVLSALSGSKSIQRIFVATSPKVPGTTRWLCDPINKRNGIRIIPTPGEGFVKDMALAVEEAGIYGPVLIIMADLPLVTSELIDRIIERYQDAGTPALSVYMKLEVCTRLGLRPDTVFHRDGDFIVPCGINILDAGRIREEQEDNILILDEEELALNVNTKEDLAVCERFIERNQNKLI